MRRSREILVNIYSGKESVSQHAKWGVLEFSACSISQLLRSSNK